MGIYMVSICGLFKVLKENKMKVPSLSTKRTAVDIGIEYSMTDEQVIELLKGAKVPKAQRDLFIPWFRAAEKRSIARDNSR